MNGHLRRPFRVVTAVHMAHPAGFTVDRPQGSGDWVFVCFRSVVEHRHLEGRRRAEPGDCIWYAPNSPTWYRGGSDGLDNDWAHLAVDGLDTLLAHYRMPMLRLFRPREVSYVPTLLERIQSESLGRRANWQDAVEVALEELLLRLSRNLDEALPSHLSPVEAEHYERFVSLRARIHQRLGENWDVAGMAATVNLSVPRFAVLYKRFFDVSPLQDLIDVRLALAKQLLESGSASVGSVALRCGFQNVCHFSRFFRQRVGCSPRDWRSTGPA